MKFIRLFPFHLLLCAVSNIIEICSASGADVPGADNTPSSALNKELVNGHHKNDIPAITTEQKKILQKSLRDLILRGTDKDDLSRHLADGDWEFINEFFETFDLDIPIGQSLDLLGVTFVIEGIRCDRFEISDIDVAGSGTSEEYSLSLFVTGIDLSCTLDYSYSGGFLVGSGDGTIDLDINPDTSIQTAITFNSPDFDTNPPLDADLTCNANLEIGDIEFGSFFLDRVVAPALRGIIGPLIEPLICLPLESLETMLADILVTITDVINEFGGTLTPEQTDNLYPERQFNASSSSNFLDLTLFSPIIETLTNPLENLLEGLVTDIIFGNNNGTIGIPIAVPLADNIDLVEIRILGFNDLNLDFISVIGNYTLESSFALDRVGIEIDLALTTDGTTDMFMVTTAINDLEFNLAIMLVIEQNLNIQTILTNFDNILNCISDSLFALEVTGLSLSTGDLEAIQISDLSLVGPQNLVNEVSEAILFMYGLVLRNTITFFFESTVRDEINSAIISSSNTCLEEFYGRTIYVPVSLSCWKIELFDSGVVAIDYSDYDCSNETHNATTILSTFDYKAWTENKAFFIEGEGNWTGQVKFIEDPSVSEIQVEDDLSDTEQVFDLVLTFPTCTKPCSS